MNRRPFIRKVMYLAAVAVLLIPLSMLSMPAHKRDGGEAARDRAERHAAARVRAPRREVQPACGRAARRALERAPRPVAREAVDRPARPREPRGEVSRGLTRAILALTFQAGSAVRARSGARSRRSYSKHRSAVQSSTGNASACLLTSPMISTPRGAMNRK